MFDLLSAIDTSNEAWFWLSYMERNGSFKNRAFKSPLLASLTPTLVNGKASHQQSLHGIKYRQLVFPVVEGLFGRGFGARLKQ